MPRLRTLVVEDQGAKISKIVELLLSTGFYQREDIDVAQCGIDARRRLITKQYDLMILDVVLPNRPEETPQPNGGVDLLREIMSRDDFVRPRYILGLTAFPEAFQASAEEFADYTWAIIRYEETNKAWHDPIIQLSRHIYAAKQDSNVEQFAFDFDFCVVTAIPLEFESLLRISWQWQPLRMPGDATDYMQTNLQLGSHQIRIVAACCPRMGMVSAAILATNMIKTFRPRIVVSLGICAGLKERVSVGDVAIADPSWDYQSGKFTAARFEVAPHQLALNSAIRRRLSSLGGRKDLLSDIRAAWNGRAPLTELRVHIGPFASGSAVLADRQKLDELKLQHRQLIAIDMEVYGIYAAAAESSVPLPIAMAIKGISDFGDETKADVTQAYASYVSAKVFEAFVRDEYLGLVDFFRTS